jgi:hypothetical protein
LAPAPKRAKPEVGDVVPERHQRSGVGWDGMVSEETVNNLLQPPPLVRYGVVHASSQLNLNLPELHTHAIATRTPVQQESPRPRRAADMREAQEIEGLRFALTTPRATGSRVRAKFDQTRLIRVQRQREFRESVLKRVKKPATVGLTLESDAEIIGISHDDHPAGRLTLSPARGPEVEDVVEIYVGK